MAGVISKSQIQPLLEPTLRAVWQYNFDLNGSQYDTFWDVQKSFKNKESIEEVVIPTTIPQVDEGGMYPRVELKMGRTQTWVHLTYKCDIVITKEAEEDNLYDGVFNGTKALASAVKRTIETQGALIAGHGVSTTTTPDLQPLFSVNHGVLYPTGQYPTSWSNRLINTPLSTAAMKKFKTLFKLQREENGAAAPCVMTDVFCGPQLWEDLQELKGSPGRYDSADRAMNQAAVGWEPHLLNMFIEDTVGIPQSLVIGMDRNMSKAIMFDRVSPSYEIFEEKTTGNTVMRTRFRNSFNVGSPRGLASFDNG